MERPGVKKKHTGARRPTRRVSQQRTLRAAVKGRGAKKLFVDASLYGSVPGMEKWALLELKQMRDEW